MENKVIDINIRRVESYIKKNRPPVEMRSKLDLGYKMEKNIIEIFSVRPVWDKQTEFRKHPFAKIRFIKSKKIWKLYWMRASGKWESYEPLAEAKNIQELLNCLDTDEYGCFIN